MASCLAPGSGVRFTLQSSSQDTAGPPPGTTEGALWAQEMLRERGHCSRGPRRAEGRLLGPTAPGALSHGGGAAGDTGSCCFASRRFLCNPRKAEALGSEPTGHAVHKLGVPGPRHAAPTFTSVRCFRRKWGGEGSKVPRVTSQVRSQRKIRACP